MTQGSSDRKKLHLLFPATGQLFANNRREINRVNNGLLSFTAATGIILYICLIMLISLSPEDPHNPFHGHFSYLFIYASLLFICIAIFSYCHTAGEEHPFLILPLFYFFFIALYTYTVLNYFFSQPGGQAFTFQLVMILMPIAILDRSWHLNFLESVFLVVFIYFDLKFRNKFIGYIWRDNMTNMCISYLVGILGGQAFRSSRIQALDNKRLVIVQRDTDELTSLPNRRRLFHELRKSSDGRAQPVKCLLIADIDLFKKYNDTFGHLAGDNCLRRIGTTFWKFNKETGFELFRYGGEEFIGLYRASADIDFSEAARRLCRTVHDLGIKQAPGNLPVITASVGFAVGAKVHPAGYEEYISMADHALYEAKRRGRNRAAEYTDAAEDHRI
jgi:diguanylate cyclase (GGDEF)-like protein